jgi:hypothetical protein
MQSVADVVRSKVDHLRLALQDGSPDRERLLADLTRDPAPSAGEFDAHRGAALHMCPWHTCQATRITPDAGAGH